jgi:hypothetical protein
MSAGQWAFWLALAGFIAAAGKFLDDYHITSVTKSRARDVLVQWFMWIDGQKVPDLGGLVLRAMRSFLKIRRILLLAIGLAAAYWAILSAFYLGREVFGPANEQSYTVYILFWVPLDESAPYWLAYLATIIIPSISGLAAMAYFFHRASITGRDIWRFAFLSVGILVAPMFAILSVFGTLLIYGMDAVTLSIIFMAAMASFALPAFLAICTMALILVRNMVRLAQLVLLQVFDVASSPQKSPFAYASSVFALLILAVKVIQVALTS